MELHYNDLRSYAEKLNSQISGKNSTPPPLDDEFIEAALRQHLPRSPIWDYLRKKQNLEKIEKEQLSNNRTMIEQLVKADQRLNSISAGIDGLLPGVIEVLVFQVQRWSHGKEGINCKDNLFTEPAGKGFVNLRYGFGQLGKVDIEHAEKYKETLGDALVILEARLRNSYQELEKTATEIERISHKLREELAVIRIRRIVPGRCRFCPL